MPSVFRVAFPRAGRVLVLPLRPAAKIGGCHEAGQLPAARLGPDPAVHLERDGGEGAGRQARRRAAQHTRSALRGRGCGRRASPRPLRPGVAGRRRAARPRWRRRWRARSGRRIRGRPPPVRPWPAPAWPLNRPPSRPATPGRGRRSRHGCAGPGGSVGGRGRRARDQTSRTSRGGGGAGSSRPLHDATPAHLARLEALRPTQTTSDHLVVAAVSQAGMRTGRPAGSTQPWTVTAVAHRRPPTTSR